VSKTSSTNYSAAGTQFPIATDPGDDLEDDDLFLLQAALEQHTHDSTRGLAVRRLHTSSAPASTGQVQIDGNDLKWWAAVAAAVRTAATIEGANTWTGAQRFNQAVVMPHLATPAAPGAGLSILYPKTDGLFYRRSGTGAEVPVGTTPGALLHAKMFDTLGTAGTWAELRSVNLSGGDDIDWVLTFDGTSTEKATVGLPVPPGYAGTPITFYIEWYTSATSGNAAFQVEGSVTGTGGDLTAAMTTLATRTAFAAQGTTNRKQLSALSWTGSTPAANDWLRLRFTRQAGHVDDTINGVDVNVLSVALQF
jgi:hypothetical protein